jgi:hypothetical protein
MECTRERVPMECMREVQWSVRGSVYKGGSMECTRERVQGRFNGVYEGACTREVQWSVQGSVYKGGSMECTRERVQGKVQWSVRGSRSLSYNTRE